MSPESQKPKIHRPRAGQVSRPAAARGNEKWVPLPAPNPGNPEQTPNSAPAPGTEKQSPHPAPGNAEQMPHPAPARENQELVPHSSTPRETLKFQSAAIGKKGRMARLLTAMAVAATMNAAGCAAAPDENGDSCNIAGSAAADDLDVPSATAEAHPYVELLQDPNMKRIVNMLASLSVKQSFFPGRGYTSVNGYQAVITLLEQEMFDLDLPAADLEKNLDLQFQNIDPATKMYIVQVAQSLWVEKNHKVPWSLADYSADQIEALFYNPYIEGGSECHPATGLLDSATQIEYPAETYGEMQVEVDSASKLYPIASKLLKPDQDQTVQEAVRFIQTNFLHVYDESDTENWDWNVYREGRPDSQKKAVWNGTPSFIPQNLADYFKQRLGGCHEPIIVFRGLLRSLNIPAFNLTVEGHGVSYVPTMNEFVHGDDMVNFAVTPSSVLLMSQDDISNVKNDPMLEGMMEKKSVELYKQLVGKEPTLIETVKGPINTVNVYDMLFGVNVMKRGTQYSQNPVAYLPKNDLSIAYNPGENFSAPLPEIEAMQKQAPQFKFVQTSQTPDANGDYTFTSSPVGIKTLDQLSDPATDLWK
jgi:hypothetical protein